ncbi:PRD domain-containing protein [Lacrimispora sp.]|uniref:PRD domain-containing protein n=1 Tax=Lacrimispora sp. TaxID=2719234 RepID=UPI00289F7556|nr:PRD domain-containing protein [Lacrimispora sp.]
MKILLPYNNNIILAEDKGQEIVLIGTGIGFGKKAGQEVDISKIDKKYILNADKKELINLEVLDGIDEKLIIEVQRIMESIEKSSCFQLSIGGLVSLLDHLDAAIKNQGKEEEHPLRWIVKRIYPNDYELARKVVQSLNDRFKIHLNDFENTAVALHFINNGFNQSLNETMNTTEVINKSINIIEYSGAFVLDKKSINYSRFVTHLRFLMKRLELNEDISNEDDNLYNAIYDCSNSIIHETTDKIIEYLQYQFEKKIGKSERTFLMIYLNKLLTENK